MVCSQARCMLHHKSYRIASISIAVPTYLQIGDFLVSSPCLSPVLFLTQRPYAVANSICFRRTRRCRLLSGRRHVLLSSDGAHGFLDVGCSLSPDGPLFIHVMVQNGWHGCQVDAIRCMFWGSHKVQIGFSLGRSPHCLCPVCGSACAIATLIAVRSTGEISIICILS
jgi:hypothetical protein